MENDTSGFKRKRMKAAFTYPDGEAETTTILRTIRPKFHEALRMLRTGQARMLVTLDLDRLTRDPRDLEDLIDVVEHSSPRMVCDSVTGSMRLATDADITMARVMVAMANKSSRDTRRRVADARERRVKNGGNGGGGGRHFGFEADGVTIREAEADEIRAACRKVLASRGSPAKKISDEGLSMRAITRDLTKRKVPTVGGGPWRPETVRSILIRPVNAGIMVSRGQPVDVPEASQPAWMREPIVDEDTWSAVVDVLTDPGRTTTPGPAPRWLGSGLYLCPCGAPMRVSGSRQVYRCSRTGGGGHVARHALRLDALVERMLIGRLAEPDALALASPSRVPGIDAAALRRERAALRSRLDRAATDHYVSGTLSAAQFRRVNDAGRARAEAIDRQLAEAVKVSPLSEIAGADDVEQRWDSLDLGTRRAILAELCVITVQPARRGARFDEENAITVRWLHPAE